MRSIGRQEPLQNQGLNLELLLSRIANYYENDIDTLKTASKRPVITKARPAIWPWGN